MINKIIVHGGIFHADDVMSVVLAKKVNPDIEIIRTNIVPKDIDEDTIVADIGEGKYDHHQIDAKYRKTGEKYAACGLFFEDYWQEIFPNQESAQAFENYFIKPIENQDNYGYQNDHFNSLSLAISGFIPNWNEELEMDEAFKEAVNWLERIVDRQILKAKAKIEAKLVIEELLKQSNQKYIILEQYIPWHDTLINTTIEYVIYPSLRGGWNISVVPGKDQFPEEWLTNKPQGCLFVHNGLYLAMFDTKENAIDAIEIKGES